MSTIRTSCSGGVAFLLMASLGISAPLNAQPTVRLSIAPFVGVGSFQSAVESASAEGGAIDRGTVDAPWFVGAQLLASSPRLPVALRLGGMRTIGGNLKAVVGFESGGCGPSCSWGRQVLGPVGDATVTTLWTDLVIDPTDWTVSPYAFAGLARRFTRTSGSVADSSAHLSFSEAETMDHVGVGIKLAPSGFGVVWLETMVHGYWRHPNDGDRGSGLNFTSRPDIGLTLGVTIPLI